MTLEGAPMDARSAIANAKMHFADVFLDEGVSNVGLEEVRFDDTNRNWLITLGFSRLDESQAKIVKMMGKVESYPRFYKVVKIDDQDGSLISIVNREKNFE